MLFLCKLVVGYLVVKFSLDMGLVSYDIGILKKLKIGKNRCLILNV